MIKIKKFEGTMFIRENRQVFLEARKKLRKLICSNTQKLPIDVYSIATALGFEIEEAEIQLPGYIPVDNPVIVVRQRDPIERKRFTVAHEIGHILLREATGHPCNEYAAFRTPLNTLEEELADDLAVELLMPMSEFKKVLLKHEKPSVSAVVQIAKHFGVSFEASIRRITEVPGFVSFSYLYNIKKNIFDEYDIKLKTGYSTYSDLGLTTRPFDIVRKCFTQFFQTGKGLEDVLEFRKGTQLIQIPSIGNVFRNKKDVLVSLFGWKSFD